MVRGSSRTRSVMRSLGHMVLTGVGPAGAAPLAAGAAAVATVEVASIDWPTKQARYLVSAEGVKAMPQVPTNPATYLYAPMLVETGEKMMYSSSPFDKIDIVVVVARKTEWKGSS
uniref:Uncharacterized protein n=1 Tax=Pristionchus pacificus TaxID=54126 RepID=A0A2A6CHB8_PRIPA|eukprot:PDM77468.1 hypothetical protein PRIPAC_33198 [Pristionchus pacificus]